MDGEQFSLCWNNFHSNLSSGFNSLLKDEDLVDVTIAAGGKFLKAHKTILSVCSPFFKDLFRANPSEHPIVILPDVNYNSLASLMQFMYQGEVSVSQDEIPMFMRVAEMLKVKGLTDNPQNESNGIGGRSPHNLSTSSDHSSSTTNTTNSSSHHRTAMKRPRPIKKVVRPMQPLRPIDSSPSPSPSPAVAHQQHSNKKYPAVASATSTPDHQLHPMALKKPKEEPIDHMTDEEHHSTNSMMMEGHVSYEENNMDLSNLIEAKLGGESSQWHRANDEEHKMQDTNSPGTLQCILGKRGNPRLIIDGHSFFKKSVYKGKGFWYCKYGRITEKCPAVCWTYNGNIIKWPEAHTHPVVKDSFNPEEDTEVPIENLQEVLAETTMTSMY